MNLVPVFRIYVEYMSSEFGNYWKSLGDLSQEAMLMSKSTVFKYANRFPVDS